MHINNLLNSCIKYIFCNNSNILIWVLKSEEQLNSIDYRWISRILIISDTIILWIYILIIEKIYKIYIVHILYVYFIKKIFPWNIIYNLMTKYICLNLSPFMSWQSIAESLLSNRNFVPTPFILMPIGF